MFWPLAALVRRYIGLTGQYAALDESLTGRANLLILPNLDAPATPERILMAVDPVISEFLASNTNGLTDEDGWVNFAVEGTAGGGYHGVPMPVENVHPFPTGEAIGRGAGAASCATALADELRERLARLGYDGELEDSFTRWTGKENLEDRVDGLEQIDHGEEGRQADDERPQHHAG